MASEGAGVAVAIFLRQYYRKNNATPPNFDPASNRVSGQNGCMRRAFRNSNGNASINWSTSAKGQY